MQSVHYGGCNCDCEAQRGEGFVRPGSIHNRQRRWNADLVPHRCDRGKRVESLGLNDEVHDPGLSVSFVCWEKLSS